MRMTDTERPAFPSAEEQSHGLTVREYFAAHAPITIEDARNSLAPRKDGNGHSTARVLDRLVMLRRQYADKMAKELGYD